MTEELDNKPLPSGEDPQAAPPKPLPAPEGISEEHPAAAPEENAGDTACAPAVPARSEEASAPVPEQIDINELRSQIFLI